MRKTPYDSIAKKYADIDHPYRKYMAYPTWLEECGYLGSSRVLDVGCGSGRSTRLLREHGASMVHGLDRSAVMIKLAEAQEPPKGYTHRITYFHADARAIPQEQSYDLITPTHVMHYARTIGDLRKMAHSMANHLAYRNRGIVGLNLRPDSPVRDFEPGLGHSAKFVGRPYRDGSEISLSFYDELDTKVCEVSCYYWTRETYENVLTEAGFIHIEWIPLRMTEMGKAVVNDWERIQNHTLACVIKATKGL